MSSVVRLLRAPQFADAPDAYAAAAPADARLVFLAGACPLEDDGTATAPGDDAARAARCVEPVEQALQAAGATLMDVISTRVLVASSAQRERVTAR